MVVARQDRRDLAPVPGARVLIVEARFYDDLADELLRGAKAALEAAGAQVEVLTVPGPSRFRPLSP